jgi:uncharacterized repeat protein (TIGR01451 family)
MKLFRSKKYYIILFGLVVMTLSRLASLASFILLIVLMTGFYENEVTAQRPFLVVSKFISQTNFSWTDQVSITLTVTNEGDKVATNIILFDYIPSGFNVNSGEMSVTGDDILSRNITKLEPNKSSSTTYTINGKEGTGGRMDITLRPAEVNYSDGTGNIITKGSNPLRVSVQSTENSYNFAVTAFLLILVSFFFGGLGAYVHLVNMSKTQKSEQEGRKAEHYFLLGGVAGVVVLATFEGLSQLFSNQELRLTTQNLVVLIGTCFAAGFAPMDIINKATERWKKEASEAENEKEKAENEKEKADRAKEGESTARKAAEKGEEEAINKVTELDSSLTKMRKLGSISADIIEKGEEVKSQLVKENVKLKGESAKLKERLQKEKIEEK